MRREAGDMRTLNTGPRGWWTRQFEILGGAPALCAILTPSGRCAPAPVGHRVKGISMAADQARTVIDEFLQRIGKSRDDLQDDTPLFGDGLQLDSLEAAELSVMLEDALGTDPFSEG